MRTVCCRTKLGGQAIVDLVMCIEVGLIKDVVVKDPLGRSDHSMAESQIHF